VGPGAEDGSLLAALPAADREALLDEAGPVVLQAGDRLFRQEDPADAVFLVEAGRLEVLHEVGGGRRHGSCAWSVRAGCWARSAW
jgi:CRP-like cAMP-binding protein